ncbi:MAG: hypothetical protein J7M40_06165 [Planctomycetes bacterium]|nr:hypothetical protein [Planctomycetota bacterium]
MRQLRRIVVAAFFIICTSHVLAQDWKAQPNPEITGQVKMDLLSDTGCRILEGFSGETDGGRWGVLATYEVITPAFSRGVFYAHATKANAWPNMRNQGYPYIVTNNKKSMAELRDGVVFFILDLQEGGYLAVTAMPGPETESWLHTDKEGRLLLSFGTFGTDGVKNCDVPLFAWARSEDIYEACNKAISSAISSKPILGWTHLRHEKEYPEIFEYLGWCSWEHFKGKINEQNMLQSIDEIEASNLPIRYIIIDMGHTSSRGGAMTTFKPKPEKFPNEWAPILKRRSKENIRWMCLWHFFQGSNAGISSENDFGPELNKHFVKLNSKNSLTPRNDPQSALAFYRAFTGSVKEYGFDAVKVDFQSAQLRHLAGQVDNAAQMCNYNSQAFDRALHEQNLGLINCNWHNPVNFFNCKYSNVGRCSMDYVKNNLFSARRHLFQSYANTLWIGQLVWCDHDMFHSSDEMAGRIMAVSKAVSGGPVYLSDAPTEFDRNAVKPLCYADGKLLRPLAPATPLPDSVFVDAYRNPVPYRVIAPLANGSAAIVVYNIKHANEAATFIAGVSPADYTYANAMIQPYPGRRPIPKEGLVLYDWYAGKGQLFDKDYTFELNGLADRLLQLSPIVKGWAVIGRTDKYLSAAAVCILEVNEKSVTIKMIEEGPLAIWSGQGIPKADGLQFKDAGNGLYKADMPIVQRKKSIRITR